MKRILPAFALLLLSACGLIPEAKDETANWGPDQIYSEAKNDLDSGNLQRSIKLFEKLEARFPYGRYAQQAQLDIAYAQYKDNEPALALAACDRFIKQHPTHPNVDYAYYLKGLINFIDDQSMFAFLSRQDMAERDPKAARESFEAFRELIRRFPESRYSEDARNRMVYLVEALARHEILVARYYLNRKAPLAAANRAQGLLKSYPNSPSTEDALGIMVLAYEKLDLPLLRDDSRRVLEKNFPTSTYLSGDPVVPHSFWSGWW